MAKLDRLNNSRFLAVLVLEHARDMAEKHSSSEYIFWECLLDLVEDRFPKCVDRHLGALREARLIFEEIRGAF
jgi:hypothetical protein